MGKYLKSAKSLGHLFHLSCQAWPDRIAMSYPVGRERKSITYRELYDQVAKIASVLKHDGMHAGDTLCIYAESSYQWAIVDWSCQVLGITVVPIYPTLPGNQADYIAENCDAKWLVFDELERADRLSVRGIKRISLEELFASDAAVLDIGTTVSDRKPEDIATIIYTSGTTGNPKGAMLANEAFISLVSNIQSIFPVDETDIFLSWLPLAHVYERFAGHVLPVAIGAEIAYSGSLASLGSDLEKVRPTIMLCVPRFLESLRQRVLDSAAKKQGIEKLLFDLAVSQGEKFAHKQMAPLRWLTDRLVGQKIREKTGGRMKFFVSGGAAMPRHVYDFFVGFGVNVLQGYGLTETCAASCLNPPNDNDPDTVGVAIPGVELKIAGDGEICLRGAGVMKGYYQMPIETAQAIDSEGWFHTGDIGEMRGKHLRITDRKKDLLVLANGKNVAPQQIEGLLRQSQIINEAVVLGDKQNVVGALIIPNFEVLEHMAKEKGIKVPTHEELLAMPEIRKAFKTAIDEVNSKLADFEKVRKFELIDAKFSVETGELTPSMKVKRKVVVEKYADIIQSMFGGS